MNAISRTEQFGGVLQEQAAILAFDRGGRPTCSSSPIVGQAVEGHSLLDQQGVEVTQELTTVTVLAHETEESQRYNAEGLWRSWRVISSEGLQA